jgi:glycosyltransferase involved in cell wall biosynthesis
MNGTDFDQIDRFNEDDLLNLRRVHGLEEQRVILYAGSFGRANDMPTLLEAAQRLVHRDDFVFVFMGHGYDEPAIREAAAQYKNVYMLPTQARAQAMAWYKLADISLISFIDRPILAVNSPTKFYDSLGAGTPVIVTNPGWTKTFVETHGCGWYTPPSDPEALAQCLASLLDRPDVLNQAGLSAELIAHKMFDRQELSQGMENILQQVVTGS